MIVFTVFSNDSHDLGDRDEIERLGPVTPGDQSRPYVLRQLPATPGKGIPEIQLPKMQDMTDRLKFNILETNDFGEVLLLSGSIENGDTSRLAGFLSEQTEQPKVVALHSPGGSVLEALQIGRLLRDKSIETIIFPRSICLSSCPYVFAGGVERTAFGSSVVGLHQHYFEQPRFLPIVWAVNKIQTGQAALWST